MTDTFTILTADRNPSVRELLRRELAAEGYRMWIVKDGTELLMILNLNDPPDLLILDHDITHVNGLRISEWFKEHDTPIPVIVHDAAPFFEKSASHVNGFKEVVAGVLREWYPDRFASFEE